MDRDVAEFALKLAEKAGCEYAEARLEQSENNGFLLKNGIPEISGFDVSHGLGMRFVHDGALGFLSTNELEKSRIKALFEKALRNVSYSSKISSDILGASNFLHLKEAKAHKKEYIVRQKIDLRDVDPQEKMEVLFDIEKTLVSSKANVVSRYLDLSDSVTKKYLVTSEGSRIYSEIPKVSFFYLLTMAEGSRSNQRYWQFGNTSGFEAVSRWNLPEALDSECVSLQKNMLKGKRPPKQKLDVVVGPEISGIMAHESGGHPTEADRILGREAAQAGESFISKDMLNTRIGSDVVSVIDDPTIKNTFGYYLYDDEGIKARKKYLYKNGIINEFLHNRETAHSMDLKSNGSSRASSFDREPIPRMSNTFIEPGDFSEEELFEDIKLGVFMKNFTEWNIDDRRFQQKYVGAECYLIENGRITASVYGPALEITTPELYSSIDACAKNLELHPGTCGKGEPMQAIPVTLGGPSIRIRNIRLN